MPERLVYISGEYYPESEARISVFDSAVMLGDTATESTRTFVQKPFKLDEVKEALQEAGYGTGVIGEEDAVLPDDLDHKCSAFGARDILLNNRSARLRRPGDARRGS